MLRLTSTTLIAAALLGTLSTGCAARVHAQASASANASWTGRTTPQSAPACPQPSPATPACQCPSGPEVYGLPLGGAQDVVFVLDCSGSMADDASAGRLPSTPFAAVAAVGMQVANAADAGAAHAPALPSLFAPASLPSLLGAPSSLASQAAGSLHPPREDKLQAAKQELLGALATLPDNTRFNVVYFNDAARAWQNGMAPMDPIRRVGAITFVHEIPASGSTAAVPALRAAYVNRPARVVFLSDGLANTGGDRNVLLQEARQQMRRGVRFDTVGLGTDQDAQLLAAMANESGGIMVSR